MLDKIHKEAFNGISKTKYIIEQRMLAIRAWLCRQNILAEESLVSYIEKMLTNKLNEEDLLKKVRSYKQ